MTDTRTLLCPDHPRRKTKAARLIASDCFWCRQMDTLLATPESASVYRHRETGHFVVLARIEEHPARTPSGEARLHATLWGTQQPTYGPVSAFARVTELP